MISNFFINKLKKYFFYLSIPNLIKLISLASLMMIFMWSAYQEKNSLLPGYQNKISRKYMKNDSTKSSLSQNNIENGKGIYANKQKTEKEINVKEEIKKTNQFHKNGIITSNSLKNLGVLKKIEMNKLHALPTNTRISEIHFIDVFGNQIPWKLDLFHSSFAKYDYLETAYKKQVPEIKDKVKIAKLIEKRLQDNAYSPVYSSSFKNDPNNFWNKSKNDLKYFKDMFDRSDGQSTSVAFSHNNDKEDVSNLGGIDLSFVLSTPVILDRIEIWMAPNINKNEEYVTKNSKTKISSMTTPNIYKFFGIESLSVQNLNNKWFYTSVKDKEFVQKNSISFENFRNPKPFAISNELNSVEHENADRVWELNKRNNSTNQGFTSKNIASDLRNALYVGGKYDDKRVWLEKFSNNKEVVSEDISNINNIKLENKIRNIISIDAPENYISIIAKKEALQPNGNLKYIPALTNQDPYTNYGWIDALSSEFLRYFYVRADFANDYLSFMSEQTNFDDFKRNINPYSKDPIFITPQNNIINVTSNLNIKASDTNVSWDASNFSSKYISSFLFGKSIETRLFLKKLNIPKINSKNIFNLFYRKKTYSVDNLNLWSQWKNIDDVSFFDIYNTPKGTNIELKFSLNDNLILNNKPIYNDLFSSNYIVDKTESFNFPISTMMDNLKILNGYVETNNDLSSLGFVNKIDFDISALEGTIFSGLKIFDVNNKSINYKIDNIEITNNDGVNRKIQDKTLKQISSLLKNSNGSLEYLKNSNLFSGSDLSQNKFTIKKTLMEFGKFSKNHKIKMSLSFNGFKKLKYFEFLGGQSIKQKRLSINKITIHTNNKVYTKEYKNYLDAYTNNFTNIKGKKIIAYPNSKINIFDNTNIIENTFRMIFGMQKSIIWSKFNEQNSITSNIMNIGSVKQALISFYGSSKIDENAIKNLIFIDENDNPIPYEIVKSYFLSGFDDNLSGNFAFDPNNIKENTDKMPKRSIFSLEYHQFSERNNYIYSGELDSYLNTYYNPWNDRFQKKWRPNKIILANLLKDENKSLKIDFSIEQFENMSSDASYSFRNMINVLENNKFSIFGNFSAILTPQTKDGDEIANFSIKSLQKHDVKIKILWIQDKNRKDVFNVGLSILDTQAKKNDFLFSVTPIKYSKSDWKEMLNKLNDKYPNISYPWIRDSVFDPYSKYKRDKMSENLQREYFKDSFSGANKIFAIKATPPGTKPIWDKKSLGYFNKDVIGNSYWTFLYFSDDKNTAEETLMKNLLHKKGDPIKKIRFNINQRKANFYTRDDQIKRFIDDLNNNKISYYLGKDIYRMWDMEFVEATLDDAVFDGKVIYELSKTKYRPSEVRWGNPASNTNLKFVFKWKKTKKDTWSIIVEISRIDKSRPIKENKYNHNDFRMGGGYWFNDFTINGTRAAVYPVATPNKTSYENFKLKEEGISPLSFWSQIPVMKLMVKFKGESSKKIKGIKVVSKGNDGLYDSYIDYKTKGPRRIDLELFNQGGDEIYSSKKIIPTNENGEYFEKREVDEFKNNDDNWSTSYFGLKDIKWTKKNIKFNSLFMFEYQNFENEETGFKMEFSLDGGSTWSTDYEVMEKGDLIIKVSKLNNIPDVKYAVIGYNYKGSVDNQTIYEQIKRAIEPQIPNKNVKILKENNNYPINDFEKKDGSNSLWMKFLNDRQKLETYDNLLEWLKEIKNPQLFKLENIFNLFKNLKLDSNLITQGTGAIGDGSDKIYLPKNVNFSDGWRYKYFNIHLSEISKKEILFDQLPFSTETDVHIIGNDQYGYIEYLNYLKDPHFQNITITINKGTAHERIFINENATEISNGDTVELLIRPKNSIFKIIKTDEEKKRYEQKDEFKIYFVASSLKTEVKIDINDLSKMIETVKTNIKFSGKEGSINILNIANLKLQNTNWIVMVEKANGSLFTYTNKLSGLNIINGDKISLKLVANPGFQFSNISKVSQNIFERVMSNLQLSKRIKIPNVEINKEDPSKDNFNYILKDDNTYIISSLDPLFLKLKETIDKALMNVNIYVYKFGSTIEYAQISSIDEIKILKFNKKDKIKISLSPKEGIFDNGDISHELIYNVKNSFDRGNLSGKTVPYLSGIIPNIYITGFDKEANLKLEKNPIIFDLLKKGYLIDFYIYRKKTDSSSNSVKINEFIDKLKIMNDSGKLPLRKWEYNVWPSPHSLVISLSDKTNENEILNWKFKNGDSIVTLIRPNENKNFRWENPEKNNEIIPIYFPVNYLKNAVTNKLPTMNTNWYGYNGNNELRNIKGNSNGGLLFPNITKYRGDNPDLDISAYVLRDEKKATKIEYFYPVSKDIKDEVVNADENNNSVPIIIQNFENLPLYNYSAIEPYKKWGKLDLAMRMPPLYNGDQIVIIYKTKNDNMRFPNGLKEIVKSFEFKTLYKPIEKPSLPKTTDDDMFYGINNHGNFNFSKIIVNDELNDYTIKWERKDSKTKKNLTSEFHSIEEAENKTNGHIKNGDKLTFEISPKSNYWWGLEVSNVSPSDFNLKLQYEAKNLKDTLNKINSNHKEIIFPNKFVEGSKTEATLKIKELYNINNLASFKNENKNIIVKKGNKIVYYKKIDEKNIEDFKVVNLDVGYKIYIVFSPQYGYIYANGSSKILSNPYEVKNLDKSFSDFIDERKMFIKWTGFQEMSFPILPLIDPKLGSSKMVYREKNNKNALIKDVETNFDRYFDNLNIYEYFLKITPNHDNNYWINSSKKNDPNSDYKLYKINEKALRSLPKLAMRTETANKYLKNLINGENVDINGENFIDNSQEMIKFTGTRNDVKVRISDSIIKLMKFSKLNFWLEFNMVDKDIHHSERYLNPRYFYAGYPNGDKNHINILDNIKKIEKDSTLEDGWYLELKDKLVSYDPKWSIGISSAQDQSVQMYPNSDRYTAQFYVSNKNIESHIYLEELFSENENKFNTKSLIIDIRFLSNKKLLYSSDYSNIDTDNKVFKFLLESNLFLSDNFMKMFFDISLFKKIGNKYVDITIFNDDNSFTLNADKINDLWNLKLSILQNVSSDPKSEFKIRFKLKKNDNAFLPTYNFEFNNENKDYFEINGISFFEKMWHAIVPPRSLDELIFKQGQDIPGLGSLDIAKMGINEHSPYYDLGIEWTHNGKKISTKLFSNINEITVGDRIKIILSSKNPSERKFQNKFKVPQWSDNFIIFDELITADMMKIIIKLNEISYKNLNIVGSNENGKFSSSKLKIFGLKVFYSVNDGAFTEETPNSLSNDDVLVIKFVANDKQTILWNGKYLPEVSQKFNIKGLKKDIFEPNLNRKLFKLSINVDSEIILKIFWDDIFYSTNLLKNNLYISVWILNEGTKNWVQIKFNGDHKVIANEFINKSLIEQMRFKYGDKIRISMEPRDEYAFTSGNKNASIEISTSEVEKLKKNFEIPYQLFFDDLKNTNEHAILAKGNFRIENWIKNGVIYEFKIIKKDGSSIYFGNTERSVENYPKDLANGDKVYLSIKNKEEAKNKSILQDQEDGGKLTQEIKRIYTVALLDDGIISSSLESLANIEGYNGTAKLINPTSSNSMSFQFKIKRKGSKIFSDFSYIMPTLLSNGDVIVTRATANYGYALINDDYERIPSFDFKSLEIKSLKTLKNYNLPNYLMLVYNDEEGTYLIQNLSISDDDLVFKLNGKVISTTKLNKDIISNFNELIIEVSTTNKLIVLNKNNDLKISKKYKLPLNKTPYLSNFNVEDLVKLTIKGNLILNKEILSNQSVDFVVKISKKGIGEYKSLEDIGEFSINSIVDIKIIPKPPSNILILDKNQDNSFSVTLNDKEIKKITLNVPKNILFEGWNNEASLLMTNEVKEFINSGASIIYEIKRDGKTKKTNSIPHDLKNGDEIRVLAQGNSHVFITNGEKNSIISDWFKVSNLSDKPQSKIYMILFPSIFIGLGSLLVGIMIFLRNRKGILNAK